ncbi:MAG: purine-nucleoside phosphorylase [Bacteroidales bacterium]|nr:purine-nucleoside phosphorylase [Bacteroidales bacterium]
MTDHKSNVELAVNELQKHGIDKPEVAVILGTGLGKLVDDIEIEQTVNYGDIPYFPVSTVEFHRGRLIYGRLAGRQVLVMQGRFHYYEGYSMQQIAFPVHIMKLLGVKYLLVSNACGTVNPYFKKGELMLITDHINQFWNNPLIGPNDDKTGPRFPEMSKAYSKALNEIFVRVAKTNKIKLNQGIYTAVAGPSLETRAEYRYLRFIGADVVGMSTIPEVLTANHIGLPVAAVSVITDECDPDHLEPINIDDILATAARAEVDLIRLFKGVVEALE